VFFREPGPWEDAGRLVLKKSRPISFAAPLSLACRAFVSPIPSLGRNKQGTRASLPAASVRTCRSPASHFFPLNFSCRYACQEERPPNSNSAFLLLMHFSSLGWWAALRAFSLFCFSFRRSFSLALEPPVASTGIERQEALKRSATRVNIWGSKLICRAGARPADYYGPPLLATAYTAIGPS
jgi:hypothetical protein